MWTVKFRNGNIKRFKFPIRTTPEGSIKPFEGKPESGDLESELLFTEKALATPKNAMRKCFSLAAPFREAVDPGLDRLVGQVTGNANITVRLGTTLASLAGAPGQYQATLVTGDREETLPIGSVVLAAGFRPIAGEWLAPFGYGRYQNVVTSPEFEHMLGYQTTAKGLTGGGGGLDQFQGNALATLSRLAMVDTVIDSAVRNPDALLTLCKLRRHDAYTFTHGVNVSVVAAAFGVYLGFSPQELKELGLAGLFHDVGKTRIPDAILNKPGRLTDMVMTGADTALSRAASTVQRPSPESST